MAGRDAPLAAAFAAVSALMTVLAGDGEQEIALHTLTVHDGADSVQFSTVDLVA